VIRGQRNNLMMQASYKISRVDVFTHAGESLISTDDFYRLQDHFGMDVNFFYVKMENAYIPVRPENTIPGETVVVSNEDAEKFDIEEERGKPVFVMNPEVIQWM